MTLVDFINQNTGKKLLYPGQNPIYTGECVQLVMLYMKQVQGVEPPVYPNAKDYWRSIPGYTQESSPQPGDIAVYDGHGAFPEGHIAVYVDGEVFEQNADPDGSPAHLFKRANTYLLGYLRSNMSDKVISQETFDDFQKWKALGLVFANRPEWPAMGGTTGNPDADPNSINVVMDDLEKNKQQNLANSTILKSGKYIVN